MLKKIIVGILLFMAFAAFMPMKKQIKVDGSLSLASLEEAFGVDLNAKKPNTRIKGVSAAVGEEIVKYGISKIDGQKKSRRQSKHFVCTSCHNVEREDPNLAFTTPEARLIYTAEKGLPFLQATTLYGAVNRDTYYNGDYEKKYGELVAPARKDIRGAIQLCAIECAQGRKLKDWELESILAYLWEIDLKLEDLNLSDAEMISLADAIELPALHEEGVKLLNTKYSKKSDATFVLPPADRKIGFGVAGNAKNGALIYENSCLHCHYQGKYSFLNLDKGKMSLSHLNSKADTYNRQSIYQVARYGTYSKYGKKSYMPRYTEERMSNQQLADLRAYLTQSAEDM